MASSRINTSDLGGPLLAAVSRSFYLSIRLLPKSMRAPIGVAYLLARASDTIADSATASVPTRLAHLRNLERMIRAGKPERLDVLQAEIHSRHEGENRLLANLGECIEWLTTLENKERGEVVDVLQKIIRGQTLDLERFAEAGEIVALQTAADLDEYTYLVAGCVGEFWTRVSLHHFPYCTSASLAALRQLGVNFGKGLQLVNILRDLPADLRAGRCYLPETELRAAGTSPAPLVHTPGKAQPVFDQWRAKADAHLHDGYRYIAALRSPRLRIACFLPWYLGVKTLRLLAKPGALQRAEKIKVSRGVVRFALVLAISAAFSNRVLDRIARSGIENPSF